MPIAGSYGERILLTFWRERQRLGASKRSSGVADALRIGTPSFCTGSFSKRHNRPNCFQSVRPTSTEGHAAEYAGKRWIRSSGSSSLNESQFLRARTRLQTGSDLYKPRGV